jgi:molybdopterin converting factor subunit 1
MKIEVRYFAVLADEAGCSSEQVESSAATLGELYDELRRRHGFRLPRASVRAAVNDEFTDWSQPPAEGITLALIPPVNGG